MTPLERKVFAFLGGCIAVGGLVLVYCSVELAAIDGMPPGLPWMFRGLSLLCLVPLVLIVRLLRKWR